ncbi:hypothetical protein [Candidatus Endoriftia persephone]|jgi:type II secretory pathway component PulJ|uniref:Uncharacterized protein n=2 Tax=Gammaproteobacteria TaxID=1236 RepID=G2DEE6_9GAMM|nr:hypothetical protein [Candidatus Endoriftia persephone]EGV51000.1 hypothetical protein Rifp1Sym_bz00060 [endosymbiont of Riftia pachyptila (vent Ph05)]USF87122.1 pyruvate-flavodoxin oxidoreductase [Candidatus Endoriftia persephone]
MEQYTLIAILGGLLVLALFLSGIVQRHQQAVEAKRIKIQRLLRGVDLVENILFRLQGCHLPNEVERLLREDLLARYRAVKKVEPKYEGIDELLEMTEQALATLGDAAKADEITDKFHLQKLTSVINELIDFIKQGGLLTPITAEAVRDLVDLIGTRRAECLATFHMQKARELQLEGDIHAALGHCSAIKDYLNRNGPVNERVKALFREAEALRKALSEGETVLERESASDSGGD